MNPSAALLLMSDGRWPTGGYAHSGGLEAAVAAGLVGDAATLEAWLRGRLRTTGEIDAAFGALAWSLAAAADTEDGDWQALAEEYWARLPVPAMREASRKLGRAVLRAAEMTWPVGPPAVACSPAAGTPWPLAFAVAARSGGLDKTSTTLAIAAAAVQGPAWAATRLLGLDPYQVAGCLSRLAAEVDEVAALAGGYGAGTVPCHSAPLLDIGAANHATWEVRLFAS